MLESLRFTTSSIKSRMYNLGLIIGSTRPARKGIAVAEWITNLARNQKNFNVEVLDLKEINLPFMDEQHHPRLKKYEHEHTRQWSRTIENKDAFIFVSPEYNYGFSAPLKNAIDFLFAEWQYKPVGFVTYGGISGGIRALQMIKQVVTSLNMVPVVEAVNIPHFIKFLDGDHKFVANEEQQKAAHAMLNSIERWTTSMLFMRGKTTQV